MQIFMGWTGLLCVTVLLYKAAVADNLPMFSALGLVMSLMWLQLSKKMLPNSKFTILSQIVIFCSPLLLNAAMLFVSQSLVLQPVMRIGGFSLCNFAIFLVFLQFYQRQQRGSEQ